MFVATVLDITKVEAANPLSDIRGLSFPVSNAGRKWEYKRFRPNTTCTTSTVCQNARHPSLWWMSRSTF